MAPVALAMIPRAFENSSPALTPNPTSSAPPAAIASAARLAFLATDDDQFCMSRSDRDRVFRSPLALPPI